MKSKLIFAALLMGLIASCKPSSKAVGTTSKAPAQVPSANNVAVAKSTNSESINSDTEIKFVGSNNLFELISKNSFYFNQAHDVIIIKGNNTIIRLINENVADISDGKSDTLVIVGNNQKYVIDVRNSISLGSKKIKIDTVQLQNIPSEYESTDPASLYENAESYLFGVGKDQSTKKAIELYEFAATKNHVPSLQKLGYIFTGKFGAERNRAKSLYYYKKGSALDDDYCTLQIKLQWGNK
jgi:hypothetical protein